MKNLTNKNMLIYNTIKKYIEIYGYSPSVRDICNIVKINSPASVHRHLKRLKEFGYITFTENKSRTIRILKSGV